MEPPRNVDIIERPPENSEELFPAGSFIDVELSDFEQVRAHAVGWDLKLLQRDAGPLRCTMRILHTSALQLALVDMSLGYTVAGRIPKGAWSADVVDATSGSPVRSAGAELAPLEFCVSNDRRPLEIVFEGPTRQIVLSAEESLIERFARALWRTPFGAADRMRFVSQAELDAFRSEAKHWVELVRIRPEFLKDARFTQTLELRIIEKLLCGCAPPAPIQAGKASRHEAARKAREYILERLDSPLSLADLCSYLEVTERTLLHGFFEIYGMGPMAYAKQSRLAAAQRDLRRGDLSVSHVAIKWGFFHFGRFSQKYREAFGYSPSQTPPLALGDPA